MLDKHEYVGQVKHMSILHVVHAFIRCYREQPPSHQLQRLFPHQLLHEFLLVAFPDQCLKT